MAKADMFLRLEGKSTGLIKGESNVTEHPDEIEIFEWSWGITGSTGLGGTGTGVKTQLSEIRFGKQTDRATTQLMSVARSNEIIKKGVLTVRKAGTNPPVDYLVVTFQMGRITSFSIGNGTAGSPGMIESFSVAFEEIEVQYSPQLKTNEKGARLTFQARVHSN